ncbi:MAG: hypothetical protein HY909_31700 [Deltaproteobacteria bacterium]|nr:hypothetical protein [Deltaproteobacteria bacterium]
MDKPPLVMVCGKPGAGKTSLVDALRALPQPPSRRLPSLVELNTGGAFELTEVLAQVEVLARENEDVPQRVLLVVAAPDRAVEEERALVDALARDGLRSTVMLCLTRIDGLPPVRQWDPTRFDPTNTLDEKARQVARWADYVRDALGVDRGQTFLCSAAPEGGSYGIERLRDALSVQEPGLGAVRISTAWDRPKNQGLALPRGFWWWLLGAALAVLYGWYRLR